jgi:cytochrome c oxidase cbb3-type subunit 2
MIGRSDLSGEDLRGAIQHLKGFSPRFADERPASPVVVPPPPPKGQDLVAQGRQLYQDAECSKCHGDQGRGDGPSASGMRDDWGWPTRPSDLTWRPLKRGSTLEGIYLSIATGLSGTPMPSYGDSLDSNEIWALVYYLESLVPTERRMSPLRYLGEEPAGWMVLRMHGPPMRGGPMGPGHPMGASPMGQEMPRRMP